MPTGLKFQPVTEHTLTNNKGVENAEKNLEQAKHRLATEKKKANDARRRIENRHKYPAFP